MTRRAIAPVDWVAFAGVLGDRDAADVRACDVGCGATAVVIAPDLACDPAETEDPVAERRADRVAGPEPGRSAAPVRPRLPVTGRRLEPDRGVDARGVDGADDGDAAVWDGELDEPCRDEDGDEEPGSSTGGVTRGVDTVGVLIDGVVMLGVLTRGVVIGPAVTVGSVAVGTVTEGTETAGTDTAGTDADGRLAEAAGTVTATAAATATHNAPHAARTIRRERLTDWTTAPLRLTRKPLV